VAASLVSFHIAPNAKGLSATGVRAFEWFLASVAVAVDAQAAGSREGFVAGRADVAILRLGKCGLAGSANVMMVLPWISAVLRGSGRDWNIHWRWKVGRQWSLPVQAGGCHELTVG
jgi:hypothetical protein